MSFICQNNTCAIAISKATFPVATNCPVCQQPLVELIDSSLLSQEDELLIASLPYVIAYPLKQTLLANDPFKRINLFKDTFLNYLKYLGLLSASEFFDSSIKDRGMVALFHQNLVETAFGKWNHYIREVLKFLKEQNHDFFCPELLTYYEQVETGKKVKKYKGEIEYFDANGDLQTKKQEATAIGMLINFRNRHLGHGTMPDDDKSIQLWNEYFPIFRSLLEQMRFTNDYPMLKKEEGQTWLLQSANIVAFENKTIADDNIWMQNTVGKYLSILPFFIVPGELAIQSSEKAKLFTYESYTGKTIKFFSPEGVEKQTSGKILDRLNLLLRDKQKEIPFTPENFTKEIFLKRIEEENKLLLDTLISEKKIIPGVYQNREQMEIKLREWIGARANIFFIAAEAGSGKTNLLAEIQRQYTERGYLGLLIRAGRMEKTTLKEQVAYLLNIDVNEGLEKYTSIAGTQAEPTFILIDGLNEANNAEAIWQEIIELSKIIEPGSIKFVVTSRANTKADLERYKAEESDLNFLYGENKDHEKGLGAYAFWLTPLDMNEMKGAWENYVAKDKSRYKPLFSFDDIATFDRAIYNQINNPLVLRLFLEIYNGKKLPEKGGKHLHIWKDWFNNFSQEEQTFLKLLADEVWLKGENELLLDDLLNNEKLKPYLTSDLVNSPYARMKNMGWVSRYVKDMNGCLGFTVEGALLYLLGVKLQEQVSSIDLNYIQNTLSTGTKLQQSAIESFLCEQALAGDLELVTESIDAGTEQMDLCVRPLLYFLKAYGVEATIEKVLEEPTENDWKVLLELDKMMEILQFNISRKGLLNELIKLNPFNNRYSILMGFRTINDLEKEDADFYFNKVNINIPFIEENLEILIEYNLCIVKFGDYRKAIMNFEKLLQMQGDLNLKKEKLAAIYSNLGFAFWKTGEYNNSLENYENSISILQGLNDYNNADLATSYLGKGMVFHEKGEYDESLIHYEICLNLQKKYLGFWHPFLASTYNCIGTSFSQKGFGEFAIENYEKSLEITLKTMGDNHPLLATINNNIGGQLVDIGDYDGALMSYEKALKISIQHFGDNHPVLTDTYNNLATVWNRKSQYKLALENLDKGLQIQLNNFGEEHPSIALTYYLIGFTWNNKEEYDKAIYYYNKCLLVQFNSLGKEHPHVGSSYHNIANSYHKMGELELALEYYEKSLDIRLNSLGIEHPSVANTFNMIGGVFLDKGRIDLALDYCQKSLKIRIENLGQDHLDVSYSLFHIGLIYEKNNENKKALEIFENSFSIREKTIGIDHLETIKVLNKISEIKRKL